MWSRISARRAAAMIISLALLSVTAACNAGAQPESTEQPPPAAAAGTITIVARDNTFDRTALTVKAGQPVTLTLQNNGAAIHNWHVLGVKDTSGKEITTRLLSGGQQETITFTIDKPGTYTFLCDVHPAEMRGKLIVQ